MMCENCYKGEAIGKVTWFNTIVERILSKNMCDECMKVITRNCKSDRYKAEMFKTEFVFR